jgi:hypothetical protein
MATAQVLFQRFWYVTSMKSFGIGVRSAAHFPRDPLKSFTGCGNGGTLPGLEA